MKRRNTLHNGSVRYIVFEEKGAWYAVGLEFNIVESGSTPQEALLLLFEAFSGYVEAAQKIKARDTILNQKADAEYEKMWLRLQEKNVAQPKNVFASGEYSIRKPSAMALAVA